MTALVVVGIFCILLGYREHEHRTERQELYQRIQAPEVAIAQAMEVPEEPQHISFDDDDAYWEARS